MKRTLALLLCMTLLCGCAMPSWLPHKSEPEAQSAAPTPDPTPTPVLTAYLDTTDTSVVSALDNYAESRGITLQKADTADTAALWITDTEPESGAADLTTNKLVAEAVEKAGYGAGCTALPASGGNYGWQVDPSMLQSLLSGEDALEDLQNCSWKEFRDFAFAVAEWIGEPGEATVTLSENDYTLSAESDANTTLLSGIFACEDGDYGALPLTPALLAAGSERSKSTLTGPLNSVYATFTLEKDLLDGTGATRLTGGSALLYRGLQSAVYAADPAFNAQLATVPLKFSFEDSDLSDGCDYELDDLLNHPIQVKNGWMAVRADAPAEEADQALGFILWLSEGGGSEDGDGLPAVALSDTAASGLNTAWAEASGRSGYLSAAIEALTAEDEESEEAAA